MSERRFKAIEVAGIAVLTATGALAVDAYFDHRSEQGPVAAVTEAPTTTDTLTDNPATSVVTIESTTTTLSPEAQLQADMNTAYEAQMDRLMPQIDAIRNDTYGFNDPRYVPEGVVGTWRISHNGGYNINFSSDDSGGGDVTHVTIGAQALVLIDQNGDMQTYRDSNGLTTEVFAITLTYGDDRPDEQRVLETVDELNNAFGAVDEALAGIHSRYGAEELNSMRTAFLQGQ